MASLQDAGLSGPHTNFGCRDLDSLFLLAIQALEGAFGSNVNPRPCEALRRDTETKPGAGVIRSLSDTDSMPAKLPAYIPRCSETLETEGGLPEHPGEAASDPALASSSLPTSAGHDLQRAYFDEEEGPALHPASNSTFAGVSSGLYDRYGLF